MLDEEITLVSGLENDDGLLSPLLLAGERRVLAWAVGFFDML